MLEAVSDFNANNRNMFGATALLNSDLSQSMVVVDGAAQVHQEMEDEGQIVSASSLTENQQ